MVEKEGHNDANPRRVSLAGASGYARIREQALSFKENLARQLIAAFAWLYQSTIVELILRRKNIESSKDGRHIPLKTELEEPLFDPRRGHSYVSNSIRTSRYTIWDFLPKQLFFQFSRVGNFYFLCVGIPQTVGEIGTSTTIGQDILIHVNRSLAFRQLEISRPFSH